jgi:hypothetical protein
MTREIMKMAREVDVVTQVLLDRKATQKMEHDVFVLFLERFAKLVREDEREALCIAMEDQNTWDLYDPAATAIQIIRARGEQA